MGARDVPFDGLPFVIILRKAELGEWTAQSHRPQQERLGRELPKCLFFSSLGNTVVATDQGAIEVSLVV